MLTLITEVIRRGSAQYCGILDRRILLEKLTDYQENDSSLIRNDGCKRKPKIRQVNRGYFRR